MSEERTKLDALNCSVNKDGRVSKAAALSFWNFVINTAVCSFNEEISDDQIQERGEHFRNELTRLIAQNAGYSPITKKRGPEKKGAKCEK